MKTTFGAPSNTTGRWVWNDQGLNCTIVELMNYAEVQYCQTWSQAGINLTPDMTTTTPTYYHISLLRRNRCITIPIWRISPISCDLQDRLERLLRSHRTPQAPDKLQKQAATRVSKGSRSA